MIKIIFINKSLWIVYKYLIIIWKILIFYYCKSNYCIINRIGWCEIYVWGYKSGCDSINDYIGSSSTTTTYQSTLNCIITWYIWGNRAFYIIILRAYNTVLSLICSKGWNTSCKTIINFNIIRLYDFHIHISILIPYHINNIN